VSADSTRGAGFSRAGRIGYAGPLRIVPVNKVMSSVRNHGAEAAAEIGPALAG